MTNKRYTYIPQRMKSVNKEDPYVTGAEDIDAGNGKSQQVKNTEVDEKIDNEISNRSTAIATEKTRAEGVEGSLNTRLQTVEQLAEISVGGGDIGIGTAADFESDDPSDLAKVPTVGAMLGGANDGVYDISARHNGTKYADLAAALGTNGANVPPTLRKGGMSVKFVQSSDNKYVQFSYMSSSTADADFNNVANWQGVDAEPTAGSDNLVKSGGVQNELSVRNKNIDLLTGVEWTDGGYYDDDTGNVTPYADCRYTTIDISDYAGKFVKIKAGVSGGASFTWVVNSDGVVKNISDYQLYINSDGVRFIRLPETAQTLRISYNYKYWGVLFQYLKPESAIYDNLRNECDLINILANVPLNQGGYYNDNTGAVTPNIYCKYAQIDITRFAGRIAVIVSGTTGDSLTWFVLQDGRIFNITDYQIALNGRDRYVFIPKDVHNINFSYNSHSSQTPNPKAFVLNVDANTFPEYLDMSTKNLLKYIKFTDGGYYNDNTGNITPYNYCSYASFDIQHLRDRLVSIECGNASNANNAAWTWFVLSDNSIHSITDYQLAVDSNHRRLVYVPDNAVRINISYNRVSWKCSMVSDINGYKLLDDFANVKRQIRTTKITVPNTNDYAIGTILNGITDNSYYNRYEIYVPNGQYFELDIVPKSYVDIIGESVDGVIITCDSSSTKNAPSWWTDRGTREVLGNVQINSVDLESHINAFHIFYFETCKYCKIKNVTLNAVSLKYCAHLDYNAEYNAVFENVRMRSDHSVRCVGCGTAFSSTIEEEKKQSIKLLKCSFNQIGESTISHFQQVGSAHYAVGHHDYNNGYNSLSILIDSCLTNVGFIEVNMMGGLTQQEVIVKNCKTTSETYSFEIKGTSLSTNYNYLVFDINNEYIENTISLVNRPDFYFGIGLY